MTFDHVFTITQSLSFSSNKFSIKRSLKRARCTLIANCLKEEDRDCVQSAIEATKGHRPQNPVSCCFRFHQRFDLARLADHL